MQSPESNHPDSRPAIVPAASMRGASDREPPNHDADDHQVVSAQLASDEVVVAELANVASSNGGSSAASGEYPADSHESTLAKLDDSPDHSQQIVAAEVVSPVAIGRRLWRRVLHGIREFATWCFGMATLTVGLAGVSSIPLLQLVGLGYFLESSGRIARSGRVRDGWIGYRTAARVGTMAIGLWLTLIPIRVAANFSHAAFVIDPNGAPAVAWRIVIAALSVVLTMHATMSVLNGGRIRDFLWPVRFPFSLLRRVVFGKPLPAWLPPVRIAQAMRERRLYATAREQLWGFLTGLRLPQLFWLGARGYLLTLLWIGIPGLIMASALSGSGSPPPILILGGLLMAVVVMYVPILQAQFAAEGDWRAMLRVGHARKLFARAPIAMLSAILLTFVLSVPLYLAKIEATNQELTWLANILFVTSILPSRWAAGWATARARRRESPRHKLSQWVGRILIAALALAYVLIISLAAYVTWDGGWSVLQQHAFLIPGAYFGR